MVGASWRLPTLHEVIRSDVFDLNVSPFFSLVSTTTLIAVTGYYWIKQQRTARDKQMQHAANTLKNSRRNAKRRRNTLLVTPMTIAEISPENRKRNIVVLGLTGAGKTAFLQRLLHTGDGQTNRAYDDPEPTLGVKMISVERHGLRNNYYEVGGAHNTRAFVKEFLHVANLVIFVVDAASEDDILDEANQYYQLISARSDYCGPIVVIASKQDLPNARSVREIYDRLEVSESDDVHVFSAISAPRSFGDAAEQDQLTGTEDDRSITPKVAISRNVQILIENLLYRSFS